MKQVVLKVDIHDARKKHKTMKAVSTLSGIDSIAVDMIQNKMTVIGTVDPIDIVSKLKKHCHAEFLTVGPPAEPKKEAEKKPDEKKEDGKKKEEEPKEQQPFPHYYYNPYPYMAAQPIYSQPYPSFGYRVVSPYDNPNGCVIS